MDRVDMDGGDGVSKFKICENGCEDAHCIRLAALGCVLNGVSPFPRATALLNSFTELVRMAY
jgi:hypothetical protein